MKQHWTSVLLRSMLLSRLSCLTSCREFFQDFFWHSQCHWMILLSPTLPRGLESILFPQKSTVKSEKGSNRKCMHFQLWCLLRFWSYWSWSISHRQINAKKMYLYGLDVQEKSDVSSSSGWFRLQWQFWSWSVDLSTDKRTAFQGTDRWLYTTGENISILRS